MGDFTEHVRRKLEQDIQTGGLLVWLDKEGDFTSLVDELIELHRTGQFAYPVFAFRGSFLELMIESRAMLASTDRPKCVVHMPGFNTRDIKNTPFYEAYKAGRRWWIKLDTIIRECAQGRLSPDRIETLLRLENLNLDMAERFLSDNEEAAPELRPLLNRYGENGLVLRFLEDPDAIGRELAMEAKESRAKLREYFLKLLGVDDQWQNDWSSQHGDDERAEDLADLLASYLLCMEYAGDLTIEAPSERLRRLRAKPREYHTKTAALLQELRRDNPVVYMKRANQIEASLTDVETVLGPSDLGAVDTFRFEADIFMAEALKLLSGGRWHEAQGLSQTRLGRGKGEGLASTFWLTRDVQRQWLWEWIDVAATLGAGLQHADHTSPSSGETVSDLLQFYAATGWKLDRVHRSFAVQTERYSSGDSPLHFKSFVEIRTSLNRLYRAHIDAQSRAWNVVCERSGFLGPVESRQRDFFGRWVKPHLGAERKTALILADALRYELGEDLVEMLESEDFGTVCVDGLLAELPTITAVGMNALVPTADGPSLTPILDARGGAFLGFQGGQRQVTDPDSRHRTLKEFAGVECGWTDINTFLKGDEKLTRKLTASPLLVITALDIDAMGESGALGYGIDYFEKGLGRIKTAVRKIKDSGFEMIIIVADHGFLLGNESVEAGRAARLPSADRRYAIDTVRAGEDLVSVSFAELNYRTESEDRALVLERSTHILNSRSAGSFYHGGNSPQERVIPVIRVTTNRTGQGKTGRYSLAFEKMDPVLGYQYLKVIATDVGIPELFAEEAMEVHITADDGAEVLIGDVKGARVAGDLLALPIGKSCDLYFKLTGPVSKGRIRFESTRPGNVLENARCEDFFDVEHRAATVQTPIGTSISAEIPAEYHAALEHLRKHGALSEKFLTNSLGGDTLAARKARKFAASIDTWAQYLPFNVRSEQTPEGKEYRIL